MMPYAVILNAVKNLEVSVAVDGSASLEILRYTQDDIESVRLPYAVILNEVKNLLRADQRQPALTAHSQRGDASTSLSMT